MEKQRDTILEYFPPGDVMEKDYNYYVFKSGWIYIKRKHQPFHCLVVEERLTS